MRGALRGDGALEPPLRADAPFGAVDPRGSPYGREEGRDVEELGVEALEGVRGEGVGVAVAALDGEERFVAGRGAGLVCSAVARRRAGDVRRERRERGAVSSFERVERGYHPGEERKWPVYCGEELGEESLAGDHEWGAREGDGDGFALNIFEDLIEPLANLRDARFVKGAFLRTGLVAIGEKGLHDRLHIDDVGLVP